MTRKKMSPEERLSKIKARRNTPEFKAREKERNQLKYELHKEEIKARTKAARSTPEGRARRNELEKAARSQETPEQRKKRIACSERARKKRLLIDKEFAEACLLRARDNMRRLRNDDEYKTKNRVYQREWSKAKRALKSLDQEYDAFIARLEAEAMFGAVNEMIARKGGPTK